MTHDDDVPLWRSLGPGLVWAGTAVGVSHLVQSTRAGAGYGLSLLLIVVLANVFKYPAYEAGPRYAAATGTSLLEGYRRRGSWALVLFLILTVATMFTVIAAVTFVAAGMASALVTDRIPVSGWSAILLAAAVGLLLSGGFKLLERFMTAMMLLLTLSTVASVVLVLPRADLSAVPFWPPLPPLEGTHLLFVAALVGWMPSALDTAVWHSQWSLEKHHLDGTRISRRGAKLDFDVGYVGTTVLAVLFVLLGACLLYGREVPGGSAAFAAMLVDTYTAALGEWARPVILVAAFSTMLSTTVAVTDGFPRALEGAVERLRGPEVGRRGRTWVYGASLVVCALGAQAICMYFLGQLKALVDLATALTGLTAPAFAVLNLVTLRGEEVPADVRPTGVYLAFHLAGIGFLVGMATLYLVARSGWVS